MIDYFCICRFSSLASLSGLLRPLYLLGRGFHAGQEQAAGLCIVHNASYQWLLVKAGGCMEKVLSQVNEQNAYP